jgi:hypothetical protein
VVYFDGGIVIHATFERCDHAPVTNHEALRWRFHRWMSQRLP